MNLLSFNPLAASDADTRAAQTQLKADGYYLGKIDGDFRDKSESAWSRWLKDHAASKASGLTDPIVAKVSGQTILTPATLPLFIPSDTSEWFIDLNHANDFDADKFVAAGGLFVVHKATQGATYRDPAFLDRQSDCKKRNIAFAAYHFSSQHPWHDQFHNFHDFVTQGCKVDAPISVLDWENSDDKGRLPNMTPASASAWVEMFRAVEGLWPGLYGNNLIREGVGFAAAHAIFRFCWLWLCDIRKQYRDVPYKTWPAGPTFWQIGEDRRGIDVNRFQGTKEQFLAAYANRFQLADVA